jgi:DNA-directed RNA polymerase specialized sigma24 family protein
MSGDSLSFPLPLSRLEPDSCEATNLYRELRKPLLRYLVCLGLSADEEQDVVQDAFLSLHRHLASDGSQENIRSWRFRVAHNGARNRQHSYDRRFGKPLDLDLDSIAVEATPEQVVLEKEKLHRLGKAILLLTESERECLLVTEVWTSTDLKTIVSSKRNDPRMGEQTFRLTNIVRGEPDPSLFAVPSVFKIIDGGPKTVIYRRNQ